MSGGMWLNQAGGPPPRDEVLPADHDPRDRRRRRQAWTFATLVSLVLIVGFIALGHAVRWWTVGGEPVRSVRTPCPARTAEDPRDVTLGVYNATTRFGLARSVARELQARGFRVGTITNEPSGRPVPGAAVVRHGPDGKLAARTVVAQVAGSVTVQDDGRSGDGVDLVLGPAYQAMVPRPQASQAVAPLPDPVGCRRVTPSPVVPGVAVTPDAPARGTSAPPAPSVVALAPTTPPATQPATPTRSVISPAPTTPPAVP